MPLDPVAADRPPTLTDGMVLLRSFEQSDVDQVHPLADEEMVRWFGFPGLPPRQGLVDAIGHWHAGWQNRTVVAYLVSRAEDGEPLGMCDVKIPTDGIGQLSWTTYAPFRRHGFATRAVRLLCRYAFSELALERLEAFTEPANAASLATARACGLRVEGLCRSKATVGGVRRNLVLHARLRTDPDPDDCTPGSPKTSGAPRHLNAGDRTG